MASRRHARGADAPRFGLNIHTTITDDADPVRAAQHAEALGFELVTVHRDVLAGPPPSDEAWTLVTWLAAKTTSVTVAPNVLVVPNRHPVLLAKMAVTIDRLSGGRLAVALGAGAPMNARALHTVGFPVRAPGAAVAAVAETVDVLRGLWGTEPFSYNGRDVQLDGATLVPHPKRRIPIWLGAYAPRMLHLTGQRADGWLPSALFLPPDRVPHAMDRVVQAAYDAGRDPGELTLAYNVGVLVRDGEPPRPGHVVGDVNAVADGLAHLVELGFDILNLWPAVDTADERELLATTIVPAVRDRVS